MGLHVAWGRRELRPAPHLLGQSCPPSILAPSSVWDSVTGKWNGGEGRVHCSEGEIEAQSCYVPRRHGHLGTRSETHSWSLDSSSAQSPTGHGKRRLSLCSQLPVTEGWHRQHTHGTARALAGTQMRWVCPGAGHGRETHMTSSTELEGALREATVCWAHREAGPRALAR